MTKRFIFPAILLLFLPVVFAQGEPSLPNLIWVVILIAVLGFSSFLAGLYFISKYNEMRKMTSDPEKLVKCAKSAGVYTLIVPGITVIGLKVALTFVAATFFPIHQLFPMRDIFVFMLIMVLLASLYGVLKIIRIHQQSRAELREEVRYVP